MEEDAKEKRGELDGGFGSVFGDDTDEETEEETEEEDEPNTVGRFGREEGSVLWQPFIANRISKANP
jgi:hypothetical protein